MIGGSGYAYEVPKGWGQPLQDVPGFDFDSWAVDFRDNDGFSDNINVILSPLGEVAVEQVEEAVEGELSASGAEDISVNDRVTVAGKESAHVTATMSINGKGYTIDQFYTTDNDQTFIVTFSFSTSVGADDRAKVTDAVLASWTWTD